MSDLETQMDEMKLTMDEMAGTVLLLKEFLIGDKIKDPDKPSLLDRHNANTAFREEVSPLLPAITLNTSFRKHSKKYALGLASLLFVAILNAWIPVLKEWVSRI